MDKKMKKKVNSIFVIAKPHSGCGDPEKVTLDGHVALWAPRPDGRGLFFKDSFSSKF
jgi:hypothetical protein